MDTRHRRELTRIGAPAAFLAAVTIAVLLIKSALSGSTHEATTSSFTSMPTHATTRPKRATTTARTVTAARYYTVQSGDTLGAIAARENTTVDELLRLNPGIDPKALHAGQRIRVG
ncbi:MAG TPA: LysM domain-containing protein [Gaiellaceae bacterium]|nr:LysM domain-containing protein [Gaiellaceae bacterium]